MIADSRDRPCTGAAPPQPSSAGIRSLVLFLVALLLAAGSHARLRVWAGDVELWSDAAAKNVRSGKGFANLGIALLKQDRITAAIEMSSRSLAIAPNIAAYNTLGQIYERTGRYDEALEQYALAIRLRPDDAQSYYNRGLTWFAIGRYGEAVADYSRALSLEPWYREAYLNRGNALDEQGRLAAALADYTRALAIDPDYADAFYNRGIALQRAGRGEAAVRDFREACARGHEGACQALQEYGVVHE